MGKTILCTCIYLFAVAVISAQEHAFDSCIVLSTDDFYLQLHSAEFPLLLDTRSKAEFRNERIKCAVLAENEKVLAEICDSLDLDRKIFLYCEYDYRSLEACRILYRKGFRNVYILDGGLKAWSSSSYGLDRKKIRKRHLRH